MSNFDNIQDKLKEFVRKYYTNELLKGLILFCSLGLLYFIFTVLFEFYFWLKPFGRTILFALFLFIETLLLIKLIIFPITKILGIRKGISLEHASSLIGKHFIEIDDKLLNIIQLSSNSEQSELLLASIEQKAKSIESFPFKKAVNFTSNKKYLKFIVIPVLILVAIYFSGNLNLFSNSYNRIIHPNITYQPPDPFNFNILNESLNVIEGKPITIRVKTEGEIIPEEVNIQFMGQHYLMNSPEFGQFEYTFTGLSDQISFYISSSKVTSQTYNIQVIKTPNILDFEMHLDFPNYTRKADVIERNTGNAKVPLGTSILWKLKGRNVDSISFIANKDKSYFEREDNFFLFKKKLHKSLTYLVTTSNTDLKNFENLDYAIEIIPDAYPEIIVKSDIDSLTKGDANFVGQVSDDYGLSKLHLVYYDIAHKEALHKLSIAIRSLDFEEFYFKFPKDINLSDGIRYELYFEVFDNDGVLGAKSSKSRIFSYYNKTESELIDQLMLDQKETIFDLERSIDKQKENQDNFDELRESLHSKSNMNWNDKDKLKQFIERQEQYDQMMKANTEQLKENLKEQSFSSDPSLEKKKKDLQKLLEESEELEKNDKLNEELKELLAKLEKEELSKKLKQLSERNRSKEKSLERMLELTKRFYVEQKANQLKDKLNNLSKEQKELSEKDKNSSLDQNKLNAKFEDIQSSLKELLKENDRLEKPMKFSNTEKQEDAVKRDMNEASKNLSKSVQEENAEDSSKSKSPINSSKNLQGEAKKNQKSAAHKLKQLSEELHSSLNAMQGESLDEDITMLREILENLLEFSFKQENLMEDITAINNYHPEFSNKLKLQNVLKEYFEHIDDSLYTLALRQPKLSAEVFKELSNAHFYLNESTVHFADNKLDLGVSDQQYVMTSANNMANLLSSLLNALQNASPSMGEGTGDSFSLPDIIQKQGEAMEKMEKGMEKKDNDKGIKKGNKNGDKEGSNGSGELSNSELFQLYQEQVETRKALNDLLNEFNTQGKVLGEELIDRMKELEKRLLEKNYSNSNFALMKSLKQELLKLKNAKYRKGIDSKRTSTSSQEVLSKNDPKRIKHSKLKINENELLRRQYLPLQPLYSNKVKNYFKINDSIQ